MQRFIQLVLIERFYQIRVCIIGQGRRSEIEALVAGKEDKCAIATLLTHPLNHFEPRPPWHFNIANDQVRRAGFETGLGLHKVMRFDHLGEAILIPANNIPEHLNRRYVVINK
ncbi:hypothetical protein D3C81_1508990 [compost metagenome]